MGAGASSRLRPDQRRTARRSDFGRGWEIVSVERAMIVARGRSTLTMIPVAWTPATNGDAPRAGRRRADQQGRAFRRLSRQARRQDRADQPARRGQRADQAAVRASRCGGDRRSSTSIDQPHFDPEAIARRLPRADFALKLDAFLKAEGALAWVRVSRRDGNLVHGEGYTYAVGKTPALPGVEIAAEDYRRLARYAKSGRRRRSKSTAMSASTTATQCLQHHRRHPGHRPEGRLCHGRRAPRQLGRRRRRGRQWRGHRGGDGGRANPADARRPAQADDPLRSVVGRGAGLLGSLGYIEKHLATARTTPSADGRRGLLPLDAQLSDHAPRRLRRPQGLFQHGQWLGQVPRHLCRGQCRGGAAASRLADAVRFDGRRNRSSPARPAAPTMSICRRSAFPVSSSSRTRSIMARGSTIRASTPSII